jgi:hypothetical protein
LSQYVHTYFEPKIQPDPKFKTWLDRILNMQKPVLN